MRVIAGRFRGRLLASPDGKATRPITDRAKETLFNILGARFGEPGTLPAFDVLDVFAGTGGLGIEALSRGCRSCTFVERDRHALAALRRNIEALKLHALCRVAQENAWTLRVPRSGYGLIFLDPPYRDLADELRLVDLIERLGSALASGGLMVFRYELKRLRQFPAHALQRLRPLDIREIGTMGIALLVHGAAGEPGHGEMTDSLPAESE